MYIKEVTMDKKKFNVTGMTCSACSSHVEKAVGKTDGVISVSVNLLNNNMIVNYDDTITDEDKIIKVVQGAGYNAFSSTETTKQKGSSNAAAVQDEIRQMKLRLIISFSFLIPLLYISMGGMLGIPLPSFFVGHANSLTFALTQFLLSLPIFM